jgi:N-acetyl-anhydromuramyl-L-alanine amidase AmpD
MTPRLRHPNDSPDYPGITNLTKEIRQKYPHLTRQQAYVMAAVEIRPDRNSDSRFVGWDAKNRPVFERVEFGTTRLSAQTRSGDPTTPAQPTRNKL